MYESAATEREGERIEQLVPEAITTTANARSTEPHDAGGAGTGFGGLLKTPGPTRNLAAAAMVEGLALLAVLASWVVF